MRLLVDHLTEGRVQVRGEGHHHLVHVLRARAGAAVIVFDGAGREADAIIVSVTDEVVTLDAGPIRAAAGPALRMTLLLGLLKGEKMDLVVQKATELGVTRIVPLEAERAVVRLDDDRAAARRDRWRKIAREAARQSGRADVPEVAAPVPVEAGLRDVPAGARKILCHESARAAPIAAALTPPATEIAVAVGPEGGFTDGEVAAARAAGYAVVGLGPRILRAETAALAVLAIVGFATGDLGR